MKNIFLLFIFLSLFCNKGSAITLTSDAEISILTCSPGDQLYSLFGHTGIRVKDSRQNIDVVFNYGTFDFATTGFYWKYAQGLLPYQLSISSHPGFLYNYQQDNRSVYAQVLRLDSLEKQHLVDLLLENYQPQNRSYLYNFLFDNCTTRSRDILQKSLNAPIVWHLADTGKNFWNLLDEYLKTAPWVQWGIHTILGQPGNCQATVFETMFLPDYFMYGLDSATYNGRLLVNPTETLYEAPKIKTVYPWYQKPFFIFCIGVLLIILCIQMFHSYCLLSIFTGISFLFTGLLGVLICFLGFFTEHPMTAPNWNILWANPVNLLALFFIWRKHPSKFLGGYFTFYLITLFIALIAWSFLQPAVPFASIPLVLLLIYISLKQKQLYKKKRCTTEICRKSKKK